MYTFQIFRFQMPNNITIVIDHYDNYDIWSLTVHFLKILQWWGKTSKGPIFLVCPPGLNTRSPKVWAECARHELAREGGGRLGGMPTQGIFKIWESHYTLEITKILYGMNSFLFLVAGANDCKLAFKFF
jgi:hypothetical protein